jgi:phosphosulfolactate phosphohydrolase-like enzyme
MAGGIVKIDSFPESAFRYLEYDAIVAVAVMHGTTAAVTAAAAGRRVLVASSASDALRISQGLRNPLLAGEGETAQGLSLEVLDSPLALARRQDVERPLVLCSPPGTHLLRNTSGCGNVYVACLRNRAATAEHVAARPGRVAVLTAGHGHELRCEDQIVAGWIARALLDQGFRPEDGHTADVAARWGSADPALASLGKSAEQNRRAGRGADVDFILGHVDDLDTICQYHKGEVRRAEAHLAEEPRTIVAGAPPRWIVWGFAGPGRKNVVDFDSVRGKGGYARAAE